MTSDRVKTVAVAGNDSDSGSGGDNGNGSGGGPSFSPKRPPFSPSGDTVFDTPKAGILPGAVLKRFLKRADKEEGQGKGRNEPSPP